jgi:ribosomal protein S2
MSQVPEDRGANPENFEEVSSRLWEVYQKSLARIYMSEFPIKELYEGELSKYAWEYTLRRSRKSKRFFWDVCVALRVHEASHVSLRVPQCKKYVIGSGYRRPEFPKVDYVDLRRTWCCLKRASAGIRIGLRRRPRLRKEEARASVLFVCTEHQNSFSVKDIAERCGSLCVTDYWIGGTITNWEHTKERVLSYNHHKSLKLPEGSSRKAMRAFYRKRRRLAKGIRGLSRARQTPRVIIIVDPSKEKGAVNEAKRVGALTVAIGGLTVKPECVDYFIPGNAEANTSVNFLLQSLTRACGLLPEEIPQLPEEERDLEEEEGLESQRVS